MAKDYLHRLKKLSIYVSQCVFFPIHLVLRFLVRLLLIFVLAGTVIIILLVTFCLTTTGWDTVSKLMKNSNVDEIFIIFLILSSLGALSYVINFFVQSAIESLRKIYQYSVEIISDKWMPKLEIGESITETWNQIEDGLSKVMETIKSSVILYISVFMATILVALVHKEITDNENWQRSVEADVKSIQQEQLGWLKIFGYWQEEMITAESHTGDMPLDTEREVNRDVSPDTQGEDNSGVSPDTIEKHLVVFSLLYPDGSFKEWEGICPDNSIYPNLELLELFKVALARCPQSKPRLKLEVKGFSSIAPVTIDSVPSRNSNTLNCEIANKRAEAVVSFLLSKPEEKYNCKESLKHEQWALKENKLCTRMKDEYSFGKKDGLAYDLIYRPWQTHEEIVKSKPVNDGILPGPRKYRSEFLNRTVQIIFKNDSCWQGSVTVDAG